MDRIDKRKLASHVALMLRGRNVDNNSLGQAILRDFPEILTETDRQLTRLAKREIVANHIASLRKQTDNDVIHREISNDMLDLIADQCVKFPPDIDAEHAQIITMDIATQIEAITFSLKPDDWHKAIHSVMPNDSLLKKFLLGDLAGFSDKAKVHAVCCYKDRGVYLEMPHPTRFNRVPNVVSMMASKSLQCLPNQVEILKHSHDKTQFLELTQLSSNIEPNQELTVMELRNIQYRLENPKRAHKITHNNSEPVALFMGLASHERSMNP